MSNTADLINAEGKVASQAKRVIQTTLQNQQKSGGAVSSSSGDTLLMQKLGNVFGSLEGECAQASLALAQKQAHSNAPSIPGLGGSRSTSTSDNGNSSGTS